MKSLSVTGKTSKKGCTFQCRGEKGPGVTRVIFVRLNISGEVRRSISQSGKESTQSSPLFTSATFISRPCSTSLFPPSQIDLASKRLAGAATASRISRKSAGRPTFSRYLRMRLPDGPVRHTRRGSATAPSALPASAPVSPPNPVLRGATQPVAHLAVAPASGR